MIETEYSPLRETALIESHQGTFVWTVQGAFCTDYEHIAELG